jgi:hypothetical protein
MYNDVPAIELGAEDYTIENLSPYPASAELSQYWRSVDPGLNSWRSFDTYQTDTSAHLVNMEKRLLNLANSAYGCGRSPPFEVSQEQSPRLGLSTMWGPGGEALRTMRYTSPNGPWGGSFSSTNSASSDYAFSPDVSRHHASLFCDDRTSQASFGSYPVSFSQSQYGYSSQSSRSGHVVTPPAPGEPTIACTMKELQYTPVPENEDGLEEADCIKIESVRPERMAPTPESCCLTIDTPSRSDYDDSMKDEVEEKSIDSDIDPEYLPSRSRPTRRISSDSRHPARSPTLSRDSFMKSTIENNRVLKSSQRQTTSIKSKTKTGPRRRSSNKNGESRPFICSFSHYGCESRFSSKNEWKRHVSSQHLQLGFYRCDSGPCDPNFQSHTGGNRTYNDFNRKDLFTQHHRRMHTPWTPANKPPSKKVNDDFEESLEDVRQRCWRERRQAPKRSRCIFCPVQFDGESAWEERMEHIGKHFEKAEREKKDLGEGGEDPELRIWALAQGIVFKGEDGSCWLQCLQGTGRTARAAVARRCRVVEVAEIDEDAVGDDE